MFLPITREKPIAVFAQVFPSVNGEEHRGLLLEPGHPGVASRMELCFVYSIYFLKTTNIEKETNIFFHKFCINNNKKKTDKICWSKKLVKQTQLSNDTL